jgi:hypothetical protein
LKAWRQAKLVLYVVHLGARACAVLLEQHRQCVSTIEKTLAAGEKIGLSLPVR